MKTISRKKQEKILNKKKRILFMFLNISFHYIKFSKSAFHGKNWIFFWEKYILTFCNCLQNSIFSSFKVLFLNQQIWVLKNVKDFLLTQKAFLKKRFFGQIINSFSIPEFEIFHKISNSKIFSEETKTFSFFRKIFHTCI